MDAHSCFIGLLMGMTGWLFCGTLFVQGYITPSALGGKLFICNELKHTENIPFWRSGRQYLFLSGNACVFLFFFFLRRTEIQFCATKQICLTCVFWCFFFWLTDSEEVQTRPNTPGHKVLFMSLPVINTECHSKRRSMQGPKLKSP